MKDYSQAVDYRYGVEAPVSAEQRNRVLRNTYWLLALSLVPTVIGAWVGMKFMLPMLLSSFGKSSGIISLVIFFAGAFGLIFAINKAKNSPAGVYLLLAFTFFMGVMLAPTLQYYLWRYANGAQLIATAFGGTALVFFSVATVSTMIKRDLSWMGKWLFVGLIMVIVAMIANIFMQSSVLQLTLSVVCVGLFSAFLLYDIKRVIDGGETNYVTATLSIYLDVYNIFVHLLHILGALTGRD